MKKIVPIFLGAAYFALLLFSLILLIKPGAALFYGKYTLDPAAISAQDGLYLLNFEINTRIYNPDTVILYENGAELEPATQPVVLAREQTGIFTISEIGSHFLTITFLPRESDANYSIFIKPYLLNGNTGGLLIQVLLVGLAAFLVYCLRDPHRCPLSWGFLKIRQGLFNRPPRSDTAAEGNLWLQSAADIVWVVYLYTFMEWVFMVTKPSFMDMLGWWDKIKILLLAALPAILAGLLALLAFYLLNHLLAPALPWFGNYSQHIPAAFLAACLALILLDNFTYTVLKFGVVTSTGLVRVLYGLMFVGIFIYLLRKLAASRPNYRSRLLAFGLFSLAILLAGASFQDQNAQSDQNRQTSGPATRPNIILLSSDGMNAENLSVYGYERDTTPFLRELARTSLVAENNFTNAAHSMGSETALLTGKSPFTTRVLYPPDTLKGSDKYQHLPGLLQSDGYRSVELGVNYYVDASQVDFQNSFSEINCRVVVDKSPLQRLKDYGYGDATYLLDDIAGRIKSRLAHIFFLKDMVNPLTQMRKPASSNTTDADRLNCLENYLREGKTSGQPLFAHVHLMGTHGEYFYPDDPVFSAGQEQTKGWMTDFYDDAILSFDRQVQNLVATLVANGQYENTILIIYSDHPQLFVTTKQIPLIIHFPGDQFAGTLAENTQNMDIAPTLLDFMDLPIPDWMEGSSLLQPVGPTRLIIAGGTYSAGLLSPGFYAISDEARKPPFYQFSFLTAIQCRNWYRVNLVDLSMTSGEVSSPFAPCSVQGDSPQDVRQQVGAWLTARGFTLPAGW